jgi:hypothetical protein
MTFPFSNALRPFLVRVFNPYRPELHYMRGPGPACRAKQGACGIIAPNPRTHQRAS